MRPGSLVLGLLAVVGAALTAADGHAEGAAGPFVSESGRIELRYESRLEPITINTMHAWELIVTTRSGDPVTGAVIEVSGGMPAHNHGLPTAPRVTRELAPGHYLLEGVRFHMTGEWRLVFEITAGGTHDTVIVPLDLEPGSAQ